MVAIACGVLATVFLGHAVKNWIGMREVLYTPSDAGLFDRTYVVNWVRIAAEAIISTIVLAASVVVLLVSRLTSPTRLQPPPE